MRNHGVEPGALDPVRLRDASGKACHLCKTVDQATDLDICFEQRLAMLAGEESCTAGCFGFVGVQAFGNFAQIARAFIHGKAGPGRKRRLCCLHRRVDIVRIAEPRAPGDVRGRRRL